MKTTPVLRPAVAFALLLALVVLWWLHAHDTATLRAATTHPVESAAPAGPTEVGSPRTPTSRRSSLAQKEQKDSLQGTDVDGAVRVDSAGRIVADRDLRRLFDYFLERLGERPLQELRTDLIVWLQSRSELSSAARAAALALFDQYIAIQLRAMALGRSTDLSSDMQRLSLLRGELLGADLAEAWFGDDERYAQQTLQRLALQRDASLPVDQRTASLASLEEQADPTERAVRAASTDFQLAVAQSEHLANSGTGAAARHEERAALWGDDAATLLADLDRRDAEWNSRLTAYALARATALADTTLSNAAREQRLILLLSGFSESERRRVLALAAAGLLPSG